VHFVPAPRQVHRGGPDGRELLAEPRLRGPLLPGGDDGACLRRQARPRPLRAVRGGPVRGRLRRVGPPDQTETVLLFNIVKIRYFGSILYFENKFYFRSALLHTVAILAQGGARGEGTRQMAAVPGSSP